MLNHTWLREATSVFQNKRFKWNGYHDLKKEIEEIRL